MNPTLRRMTTNVAVFCLTVGQLIPVAALYGAERMAAASVIPGTESVDYISRQNLAWWFIALAGIAITSWTFFAKWLLAQLESQRKAHTDSQTQLINILKDDHANAVTVLKQVADVVSQCTRVMGETSNVMGRVVQKMADQERIYLQEAAVARREIDNG